MWYYIIRGKRSKNMDEIKNETEENKKSVTQVIEKEE